MAMSEHGNCGESGYTDEKFSSCNDESDDAYTDTRAMINEVFGNSLVSLYLHLSHIHRKDMYHKRPSSPMRHRSVWIPGR